ncbi:MAG: helix-turn-helix domain-containing protein [Burkholderiaceae bacterium]|nr:helix-turn-helix domain-containing protein [Burkholderiaceae bacterium]
MIDHHGLQPKSASIDAHVGLRVKQRRVELGMSQEDLARKLDTTWQQVLKHETGDIRLTCGRLYELSRVLKVPMEWFFIGAPGVDLTLDHERLRADADDALIGELVETLREIRSPSVTAKAINMIKLLIDLHRESSPAPDHSRSAECP